MNICSQSTVPTQHSRSILWKICHYLSRSETFEFWKHHLLLDVLLLQVFKQYVLLILCELLITALKSGHKWAFLSPRNFPATVIINRVWLGHFHLIHSYLMSGDNQPICESCRLPLTVKHILVDCPNLQDAQLKYFIVSSLKDLFEHVDIVTSSILSKKLIFIINCSICYLYFIVAKQPWFYHMFLSLNKSHLHLV